MAERRRKKNLKSVKRNPVKAKKKTVAVRSKKAAKVKAATLKKTGSVKPADDQSKTGAISVSDMNGKVLETITLDALFTSEAVNTDVVYQAVLMYQAGEREGTAATKTRGEVRGGGKKPWKQKGTGQARHGSRRSPIWRGGGVTFGPHPRDYSYSLPAQLRRRAVTEGMKDKISNGKFYLLKDLNVQEPRTKIVAGVLDALKLEKPLFMVEQKTQNLMLASRNIPGVSVKTADEVNILDVVGHKECVLTKGAYSGLLKRLKA